MTSVSVNSFAFWYLGVLFLIKRVLEASNILYLGIRKAFYSLVPVNLKHFASMKEIPDHRKGSEGFLLESVVWVLFYYFWWGTNTIIPGAVRGDYVVVSDCSFHATGLFDIISWERPLLVWVFLVVGNFVGFIVNSSMKLDMIKWVGVPSHNIAENIFTRMFGWYLFQVGLATAYAFSREDSSSVTNF